MANATFHEGEFELGVNDVVYLKYIKANFEKLHSVI